MNCVREIDRILALAGGRGVAVALDVVYAPQRTPFLERAKERGLACDNGLGMLARQGALAFELWLGLPPPVAIMRAAIDARWRDRPACTRGRRGSERRGSR